jgi:hypothetical protein
MILWSIGLSILIIAGIIVTFYLMFYTEVQVDIRSADEFNREIPGLNLDFPTTGNHCNSDYFTYAEIQNPNVDAGWIHYGNQTDIENFMMKYCGMTKGDIELFRGLSTT